MPSAWTNHPNDDRQIKVIRLPWNLLSNLPFQVEISLKIRHFSLDTSLADRILALRKE
jgi:hypothetical protein